MIRDALASLSMLSLFLQSDSATVAQSELGKVGVSENRVIKVTS